jgi:hypothetical protein
MKAVDVFIGDVKNRNERRYSTRVADVNYLEKDDGEEYIIL